MWASVYPTHSQARISVIVRCLLKEMCLLNMKICVFDLFLTSSSTDQFDFGEFSDGENPFGGEREAADGLQ
jgi:hypothetical protein